MHLPELQAKLEADIDRALKALPEIPAPPTLIARVMQAIARTQALPWFRRAWQTWPPRLRVVSFAVLVLLFGGLCYGVWQLADVGMATASQKLGPSLSMFGSLWAAVNVVYHAAISGIHQMNRNVLIGCIAAIAFAYAMCAVMGTFLYALVRNPHRFSNEN
jgi:hypothetical protein